MGLGISLVASKPGRRWSGIFKRETNWQEVLASAALEVTKKADVDFLLTDLSEISQRKLGLNICEEWLDVEIGENTVSLSARTTTCGPGYHALVCDFVDYLKSHYGLNFGEDEENFDEAEYFGTRDFSALQKAHAEWLQGLARMLVRDSAKEGGTNWRISMPMDALVPTDQKGVILGPRGPVSIELFRAIAEAGDDKLLEYARDWFPWWDRKPSPADFRKMGAQLMWVDVPWHVPANESERKTMEAAKLCFDHAAKDTVENERIPKAEIDELEALLAPGADETRAPAKQGAGYRREVCFWPLSGGWSFHLSGYWYLSEDDGTSHFHFGNRNVFVSTFGVSFKDGQLSERPLEPLPLKDDEILVDEYEADQLYYRLIGRKVLEPETPVHLQAFVSDVGAYLIVTFSSSVESWREDIPKIVRSIRHSNERKG